MRLTVDMDTQFQSSFNGNVSFLSHYSKKENQEALFKDWETFKSTVENMLKQVKVKKI